MSGLGLQFAGVDSHDHIIIAGSFQIRDGGFRIVSGSGRQCAGGASDLCDLEGTALIQAGFETKVSVLTVHVSPLVSGSLQGGGEQIISILILNFQDEVLAIKISPVEIPNFNSVAGIEVTVAPGAYRSSAGVGNSIVTRDTRLDCGDVLSAYIYIKLIVHDNTSINVLGPSCGQANSSRTIRRHGSGHSVTGAIVGLIVVFILAAVHIHGADAGDHVALQDRDVLIVAVGLDAVDAAGLELVLVVLVVVLGNNLVLHEGEVTIAGQTDHVLLILVGAGAGDHAVAGALVVGVILADTGNQTVGVLGHALQSHQVLVVVELHAPAGVDVLDQLAGGRGALLHLQRDSGAILVGVDLIVVADLGVLNILGLGVGAGEDDLAGTGHVSVLDVDDLGHAAVGGHNDLGVIGGGSGALAQTIDIGDILHAGVDGEVVLVELVGIRVGHDEHGVGVGSVADLVVEVDVHAGLAVLNVQSGVGGDGLGALVGQAVHIVLVLGVGDNVVLQRIGGFVSLHLDHGSVGEDQAGIVSGALVSFRAVLIIVAAHGQNIGIVIGDGGLINIGHIALGVQIGHHAVVHVLGDQSVLCGGGIVLIGGTIHHKVVAVVLHAAHGVLNLGGGADRSDLTLHPLGGIDRLDLVVGVGVDHHVVLVVAGGVKLIAGPHIAGAVQIGQGDGATFLVHLQNRGGILVNNGHMDRLIGPVHIDVGDDAVAGPGAIVLQLLGHEVGIVIGLVVSQITLAIVLDQVAVLIDIPGVVLSRSLANLVVQSLAGHLRSERVVRLRCEGAHFLALILPDVGGAAKVVLIFLLGQIALIQLLAQLHDGAGRVSAVSIGGQLLVDGGGVVTAAGHILVGDAAGDGDVANSDVLTGLLGLYGTSFQSIQHQLSHIIAGHSFLHAGVHIGEQVNLVALSHSGQLPVAAEVSAVLEVTQRLHDHQGGLGSGHALAAAVGGGAGASGDLVGVAGSHIGLRPRGHVGKGAGVLVGGHVVSHQIGHDNGHLVAGDFLVGVKVAGLVAHHDANRLEHFNGFHVIGVGHIRVAAARGAGAHHHQAGNHGRGETQAESTLQVSHWNSSF